MTRFQKRKPQGPTIKRGMSKQDYQTDPRFITAVKERFGELTFDLAATEQNAQAPRFYSPQDDSLAMDWSLLEGNLWLNCEFATAPHWAAKCACTTMQPGTRILLLTPASIGTNWFADHVHGQALVFALRPRLTFVGETNPYPRDLILSVYGMPPGFECWRWR